MNTTVDDVINFFESTISDNEILPEELEIVWLIRANAIYSVKLDPLNFDKETLEYDTKLSDDTILILSELMKKFYQQRRVSRVNKQVGITGGDVSIDGMGNGKKYAESELKAINSEIDDMIQNHMPTAYNE